MIEEDLEWNEEFGIGVEQIDSAHQELFRIMRRLFMVCRQQKKNQWAGEEGIKYLKTYCMRHFEEEEAYMRSIGYKELPGHHAQHVYMREKVVPRIERHFQEKGYTDEAVEKFLDIMRLWLTRHIMRHDKAIVWEKASPAAL